MTDLASISSLPADNRLTECERLLSIAFSLSADAMIESLVALASHLITADPLTLTQSRVFLTSLLATAFTHPTLSSPHYLTLLCTALLQPLQHSSNYDNQLTQLLYTLAQAYEDQQEYILAAQALSKIVLEASWKRCEALEKVKIWNWIARLYLAEEDAVNAEIYLNKMAKDMHDSTLRELKMTLVEDHVLNLQFKASQAKVLDFKRQFFPAAGKYIELSKTDAMAVSEQLYHT